MVKGLLDMLLDDGLQILEVNAIPRLLRGHPLEGHMQFVVVAMPGGVGALAKDLEIFLLGPVVVPQLVGGIETGAAGDVNVFHGAECESTFVP